ncbi:hypothetical protein IQ31_05544 [Sphingobacterium siyangense]|uniref:Uncharacterized protein n=1 Tax=Sphingobacterium siyangense TaxID=459529 RepID=A0A562LZQ9_9SPHI|nr:hypothetical protein IQ31_05544 [Sphingobacterium siyangense]
MELKCSLTEIILQFGISQQQALRVLNLKQIVEYAIYLMPKDKNELRKTYVINKRKQLYIQGQLYLSILWPNAARWCKIVLRP